MNSEFNYRRIDEMKVEVQVWLRKLTETYQQMMMGERANYGQQPGIPEEGAPMSEEPAANMEVLDAGNNSTQATGL